MRLSSAAVAPVFFLLAMPVVSSGRGEVIESLASSETHFTASTWGYDSCSCRFCSTSSPLHWGVKTSQWTLIGQNIIFSLSASKKISAEPSFPDTLPWSGSRLKILDLEKTSGYSALSLSFEKGTQTFCSVLIAYRDRR